MRLDRPPAFMRQFLHQLDVLVINTGNHWSKGKFQEKSVADLHKRKG